MSAEEFGAIEGLPMGLLAKVVLAFDSDPFGLGSYSVARPHAADERRALATPLAERIYFAGEAASTDGWAATVAGAYFSGRNAALQIMQR